jgi:hypothetical protein
MTEKKEIVGKIITKVIKGAGYDDDGRAVRPLKKKAEVGKKPEEIKKESRELVEKLKKGEQASVPERHASVKKEAVEDAVKTLKLASEKSPELAKTLGAEHINKNSLAAAIASEILNAPIELQNDPNYLISKGLELSGGGGGLSREAHEERLKFLQAISTKVQGIAESQGNAGEYDGILQSHFPKDVSKSQENLRGNAAEGGQGGNGDDGGNGESPSETEEPEEEKRKGIFDGLSTEGLPPHVIEEITSIQEKLKDPNLLNSEETLEFYKNRIRDLVGRGKERLPLEQAEMVDEHTRRIGRRIEALRIYRENEQYRQRKMEQQPTTIYLSESEIEQIKADPIGYIDSKLAELEANFRRDREGPITERDIQRLRLKIDYLLSDEFDVHQAAYNIGGREVTSAKARELKDDIWGVFLEGKASPKSEKYFHLKERLKKEKKKFFEMYTVRLHGVQFMESYSNAEKLGGEQNRFYQLLNGVMNERDWFGLDGLYGGLVGDAVEVLKKKYEAQLIDENGNKRLLGAIEWDKALKQTTQYLRERKHVYGDTYERYLKGEFLLEPEEVKKLQVVNKKVDNQVDNKEVRSVLSAQSLTEGPKIAASYEDACESMTNLAGIRMQMWMDKAAIEMRGASPKAGEMLGSDEKMENLSSYLRKHKLLRIKRWTRWWFEQWGSATGREPAEKAVLRRQVWQLARGTKDIRSWAKEMTSKMWTETEALQQEIGRHNVHLLKSDDLSGPSQKALAKLKYTFFYDPDFPPDKADMFNYIQKLSKERLTEENMIQAGIDVADSHLLRPYLPLESTWRRDTVKKEIKRRLRMLFPEPKGVDPAVAKKIDPLNRIFTTDRMTGAAAGYYEKKFTGDPVEAQVEYVKELHDIARFRPHDLTQALLEGDSVELSTYYGGPGKSKGVFAAHINDLSLRASILNRRLMNNLQAPIDFSEGLNSSQQELVDGIYKEEFAGVDGITKDKFFSEMKGLSDWLRGKPELEERKELAGAGKIKELLNIRYEPMLTNPRWQDDLPIDLLENPDRVALLIEMNTNLKIQHPEVNLDEIKKFRPISVTFSTESEDEQSGMARRAWKDAASAESGMELIGAMLEPSNKEELPKILDQLWSIIAPYQGPSHAGFAVTQLMGGWLGSAKHYPVLPKSRGKFARTGYGPFLEGSPNSSDFKLYHGAEAPSMSVDELQHIVHQVEAKTGKIAKNAPGAAGLFEAMEAELGITNWRRVVGGHGGALDRLLERTLGKQKYENFMEYMNETKPTGVFAMKGFMYPLYFAILLAVYTATVAAGEGKEQASGGSH